MDVTRIWRPSRQPSPQGEERHWRWPRHSFGASGELPLSISHTVRGDKRVCTDISDSRTNGQDRTDGLVDSCAVLTGFSYTPKEKKWALSFGIMTGGLEPTLEPTVFAPRTYFSTYLTYNFTKKFQSVTQWDMGWQENFDLNGSTADFWGLTQYLFCTLNDCWKLGLRYDMFVDDQGTRLGGLRYGGVPGGNPLPLPSGDAGTVQAISLGLNYIYNANLRIRPEVRWDWFGGSGPRLFDDLTQNRQFTVACDAIIQF